MNRALLQQALDELRNASPDTDYGDEWQNHIAAIEALRAELAKPEPEPVAWGYLEDGSIIADTITPEEKAVGNRRWTEKYTVPLYTKEKENV